MDKILSVVSVVILAAVALFIFLNGLPRIDRYLNIRAIEACGGISQFVKENSKEEFKAQYPVADVYKDCVSQSK